jgi:molybdopterin-containing oxidoreductase family membrane subunit
MYTPTLYDFGILIGSFGLFFTLVILFTKTLPVVSIAEVKAVSDGAQPSHHSLDNHNSNLSRNDRHEQESFGVGG